MDLEVRRQVTHALGILTILVIQIFGRFISAILVGILIIFLTLLGYYRLNRERLSKYKLKVLDEIEEMLEKEIKGFERGREFPFHGAIMFYIGAFIAIVLFPEFASSAAIAVLALGDSMSTLVGKRYGKYKLLFNKNKTIEGSLAFLVTAFIVLIFFTNPVNALAVALIAMFVEALPKLSDNLTIPIAVGLLMVLTI
jgi:dolichol kinase